MLKQGYPAWLGSSAVCAAVARFWPTSMQIALPPRLSGNTAVTSGATIRPKATLHSNLYLG